MIKYESIDKKIELFFATIKCRKFHIERKKWKSIKFFDFTKNYIIHFFHTNNRTSVEKIKKSTCCKSIILKFRKQEVKHFQTISNKFLKTMIRFRLIFMNELNHLMRDFQSIAWRLLLLKYEIFLNDKTILNEKSYV